MVLTAFFGLESEIDKYVTDEVDYQTMMKEHSVIVDGTNHIVLYRGSMNALHNVFPEDEAIDPSTVLPPHPNRNDVGYTVDHLFYVGYDYDYYPDGNLTIFTRNQLVR